MTDTAVQNWDPKLYQSAHAFVWEKAADLIALLDPKAGERVLDLGCGTGQLTAGIAASGAHVVGFDRSADMIAQARGNFPELTFDVADATTFAVERPFNSVFSNATLHWVKPPELAAQQISAALRPGGRFVAEFGGKGNVQAVSDALRAALHDVAGVDFDRISPWYYPSVAQYAGVLENAGLDVTFATLFPRPTQLEGVDGLKNWVKMFGGAFLEPLDAKKRDEVLDAVERHARPVLFRDGSWFADYVRLRVVAIRR
jgi:trans-aconitate 2-methyltransferase